MRKKFGPLEKKYKNMDIMTDKIFQKNSGVHPFWPQN